MEAFIDKLPEIISAAAKSNLGILALLSIALSFLAYVFFYNASEVTKIGIFILLFVGVSGFGFAIFLETPKKQETKDITLEPTAIDDTEYIIQPYTTENDGRKSKSLTCPPGKIVVPESAKCLNTAGNKPIRSEMISTNTWYCEWPYQEIGIGIWVEMACKSP